MRIKQIFFILIFLLIAAVINGEKLSKRKFAIIKPYEITLISTGYHVGFALNLDDISLFLNYFPKLKTVLNTYENSPFIEIGWGEEVFYMKHQAD